MSEFLEQSSEEGLRYIEQFTPLIGELAIGQKVRLTPQDEIIDKEEIRPMVHGLEYAFSKKVNDLNGWPYMANTDMSRDGHIEDWLIGRFAGKLSNLELTRLPNEASDILAFIRRVMKKGSIPVSLNEHSFTHYALSVDKKSTGRSPLTSIAQIGYYFIDSRSGSGIQAGFRVVDDRSRADFDNAVNTARMLESVQVINTVQGGAARPR